MTQLASFTAIDRMQKTQRHCDAVINALGAYYISSDGKLPNPSGELIGGFGEVPFKELGIMEKFARDGHGEFLLYRINPFFDKKTSNPEHINLGIDDFSSTHDDKVALVLKAVNKKGNEIYKVWYSERNFKAMFQKQKSAVNTEENSQESSITETNRSQQPAGAGLLDDD